MSKYDFPTQFECQNRILNIKIGFSDSVRISKNEKRKTKSDKRKTKAKNENQTNFTLLIKKVAARQQRGSNKRVRCQNKSVLRIMMHLKGITLPASRIPQVISKSIT